MTELREKKSILHRLWAACPIRNSLAIAGAVISAMYFALRGNMALMSAVSEHFVQPYHHIAGRFSAIFPFSLAELCYTAAGVVFLIGTARILRSFIRGGERPLTVYRYIMGLCAALLCFYGGMCLLWGVYYHSSDFSAVSGIEERPISTEELEKVTAYFAEQLNDYAPLVPRENGLYSESTSDILRRSADVTAQAAKEYPFLQGYTPRPKPMVFSRFMSWINFTGFFFPFTGEANLNTDAPICLLPATAAHEIAHLRGVAAENEANFTAVLACMTSDDTAFRYSGAMLAYIHLGNALYSADPEAYWNIDAQLSEPVRADLDSNNAYWDRYESKAAEVSERVYTGFLQSHGQSDGMQSYGACVDLLVSHYLDAAELK